MATQTDKTKTDDKTPKAPSPFTVLRPFKLDDGVTLNAPEGSENGAPSLPTDLFEQVGVYTAKTSKGAIALAIGEHGGGDYIAVPQRSFVVRSAQPVAAPRLKWS